MTDKLTQALRNKTGFIRLTQRPTLTDRENRMAAIIRRLTHAPDEALTIVEAHLGLTPRRESPDAGRPWDETIMTTPVCRACMNTEDACKCLSLCYGCMNDFAKCYCGRYATMTPVIQRGEHE